MCPGNRSLLRVQPGIIAGRYTYPRQNDLASALREVGRIERTLFIIEWILDVGMQGAPQGLSYGQRQSEQMVNKGLSVAAKYIKFRGFVRLDELEVTGSPLVMFHPRSS